MPGAACYNFNLHLRHRQKLALHGQAEHFDVVVEGVGGAGEQRRVLQRDAPGHFCRVGQGPHTSQAWLHVFSHASRSSLSAQAPA